MGGDERTKSNFLPKSQAFFIRISLRLYLKEKSWPVTSMRNSLFILQPMGPRLALEVPLFGKGGGERERRVKYGGARKRVRFRPLFALSSEKKAISLRLKSYML